MKFEDIAKSFSLEKGPRSIVELKGEVPADVVAQYKQSALTQLAAEIELPGFRKGKVPHDLVLKKIGEMGVLEEAVELFVRDFYPELVELKKIDVVGRPTIAITKLVPGNPVALSITVAIYPELELPKNWKSMGEKIPLEAAGEASDEEMNQTLESLRQSRKQGETLPELNDEFAKSLGAFESVDALKAQIKKGIGEEKARGAKDARRGKIIDALLEKVAVEIPDVFVESELEKIVGQMREDVTRLPTGKAGFGMTFDDYLKRLGKTETDIRNEFRSQAEKRAKLQLTLNKIAQDEKVEVEKEAVEHEAHHALEHFPDANPELVKIHIETVMRNEKVLKLFEGEK
jgi:FKBP-type peptidyl-prolyl cis-trans isomerase (trigger factor)